MRIVAGFSSGLAASAGTASLLAWLGHGLNPAMAAVCLLAGVVVAVFAGWKTVDHLPARLGVWDLLILTVFLLAAFRAFFWLLYPDGSSLKILSPHNLGDLSLHLGFINYFASGIPFWPPSPILVGAPLTYPPAADLFNALLLLVGVDIRGGLILTGFGLALLSAWALWRYGGAFTVAAFLFGGGLAGFAIFRTGEFIEYGSDLVWKNAFLTMLVTQRGFLFALPAGLVLLWAWRQDFFGKQERSMPLVFQALIYGTMPLFQLHTFLFLSAALAAAVAANPAGWRRPVGVGVTALIPATASVLAVTAEFSSGGKFRFEPGWALGEAGLPGFVLQFGVAIILGCILVFKLIKAGEPADWWIAGISAGIALVAFLFPFTDWAWDNTKLLIWCWIAPAPLLWKYVIAPLPVPSRAALCLLLFFSGAMALTAGLDRRHGYQLANREELAEWQNLVADLPPETVFACQPDYNHPLLLLGRRVVCGYEGHLSSHGLAYRDKLSALKEILTLKPGWQPLAESVGADFVALRSTESGSGKAALIPARSR